MTRARIRASLNSRSCLSNFCPGREFGVWGIWVVERVLVGSIMDGLWGGVQGGRGDSGLRGTFA